MTPIFDHLGIKIADFELSREFYREVLGTLGITQLSDLTFGRDRIAGFGKDHPSFWISNGRQGRGDTHVAFLAASRAEVEAFYAVALSVGGRDNGPPGIRAHYHPNYYAAFVLDLDGYNIEAVCHAAE